ncbi:MAG: ABC transporter substrate-binding protein [Beijerinckiaceae bacterium]
MELAAVAFSTAAIAQTQIPVVGFVNNGSQQAFGALAEAFRLGLADAGYHADSNVRIEYRWADGHNERLSDLLQDLAQKRVSIIVATGGTPTAIAAKQISVTIPVVFSIGADPIKFGLVTSLSKPGGNMTGVSFLANAVLPKQVEILNEIAPKNTALGFLVNPSNPNADADTDIVSAAAKIHGRELVIARAATASDIENAFLAFSDAKIGGLLIFPDATFTTNRGLLVKPAGVHKLPAIYNSREFAVSGGLIGYGARQYDSYRQSGVYAGRVLKGERPADLPVVQSTAIELVVNLKAARALGVSIPIALLGRADEVIELSIGLQYCPLIGVQS